MFNKIYSLVTDLTFGLKICEAWSLECMRIYGWREYRKLKFFVINESTKVLTTLKKPSLLFKKL